MFASGHLGLARVSGHSQGPQPVSRRKLAITQSIFDFSSITIFSSQEKGKRSLRMAWFMAQRSPKSTSLCSLENPFQHFEGARLRSSQDQLSFTEHVDIELLVSF